MQMNRISQGHPRQEANWLGMVEPPKEKKIRGYRYKHEQNEQQQKQSHEYDIGLWGKESDLRGESKCHCLRRGLSYYRGSGTFFRSLFIRQNIQTFLNQYYIFVWISSMKLQLQ